MEKINLVYNILRNKGLNPVIEDDSIFVKYEMKSLLINVIEDDSNEKSEMGTYANVLFPGYYDLSEGEVPEVLLVCNKANRELRQIKTFVAEDLTHVTSSFEFWFQNEDELENNLSHAFLMISHIRRWFYRELEKMQEESKSIAEYQGQEESDSNGCL